MLSSVRKFSNSIFAKILLAIIIIPFVFWGMGSSFTGGSKNVVVVIDKEKYSTQDFVDFVSRYTSPNQKISIDQLEEFLSFFIGEQLIKKEIDHFSIKLTDNSLSRIIKQKKEFQRDNKFSRLEYEKFLLKKGISAVNFENNLSESEKKKQLLDFIGGGILPSKFLINSSYNKVNQKRNIEYIDLNNIFKNNFNFSEKEISTYFEKNEIDFNQIYRSVKILELSPKTLIDTNEFNDVFFNTIDKIDDLISQGENLSNIILKFNLENEKSYTLNSEGQDLNLKEVEDIPKKLIKNIFSIDEIEPTSLQEIENKYFIVELNEIQNIKGNINNEEIRKKIISSLRAKTKRKMVSKILSQINSNNFDKNDFDKLSKDKSLSIKKVTLKNQSDIKIFDKDFIKQIYSFPEKKVIISHDIELKEIFLIYIDKIEHVSIDDKSEKYKEYLSLTKYRIKNELFNTYDDYIKTRYKIDINYKALNTVKNYFD